MISEFGVDPEVLARWSHFSAIWGDFGTAQRRQIGLYPKKWKQVAIERARALLHEGVNTEMQVKRMEERMFGEGSKSVFRKTDCSDWQDRSWIINAIEHQPHFETIVAGAKSSDPRVVVAGEFLRDEAPYVREPQVKIERTTVALVDTAWSLIAKAQTVVLVEPNFEPMEPRFIGPLAELLTRLHATNPTPRRIELHTCRFRYAGGQRHPRAHPNNFRRGIAQHLPPGWRLEVCRWAENLPADNLHPRFILTELGGLQVDFGLDTGEPGSTTLVSGLGDALHREYLARYSSIGSYFILDPENERFTID